MAFDDARVRDQPFEEIDVAGRADHVAVRQRVGQFRQCLAAILAVHDQFGDHRIVEHADRVALLDARVDTHAVAGRRQLQAFEPAAAGQEIALGVFRVEAHLDRVAALRDLRLIQRQRLSRGDA